MSDSVAKFIGKKKLSMVLQTKITRQKKFPLEIYRWIILSVRVNYRQNISVGQAVGDCEICTKLL